jgi:hypothetical protein
MTLRRLVAVGAVALLLGLLGAPAASLAHERRTLAAGKYDVVVGWDTEPPFVNQKNAATIRISRTGTNPAQPVTGAEKTLKVELRQGGQTRVFDLRAVFGQPGYYAADIVPTRAGDYVWTFSGSIGGDAVNEAFDSADGKFDAVVAGSAVEFPVAAPDPNQVTTELRAAEAAAERAQMVGYLGAGLGVLGLLVALLVWLTRPRLSRVGVAARRATGERVSG